MRSKKSVYVCPLIYYFDDDSFTLCRCPVQRERLFCCLSYLGALADQPNWSKRALLFFVTTVIEARDTNRFFASFKELTNTSYHFLVILSIWPPKTNIFVYSSLYKSSKKTWKSQKFATYPQKWWLFHSFIHSVYNSVYKQVVFKRFLGDNVGNLVWKRHWTGNVYRFLVKIWRFFRK